MNYWEECFSSSLGDHAPSHNLTDEQIKAISEDLRLGSEMKSETTGEINISNPASEEIKKLKSELENERRKVVCNECGGRGTVSGRVGCSHYWTSQCDKCGGQGRHLP